MNRYLVADSALVLGDTRHEPGETFESDADLGWWVREGFLSVVPDKPTPRRSRASVETDEQAEATTETAMPESLSDLVERED